MSTFKIRIVNDKGLTQIAEFLSKYTDINFTLEYDRSRLNNWARDAEYQMSVGNTPTIEISAVASNSGKTQKFTIDADGIDQLRNPSQAADSRNPNPWVVVTNPGKDNEGIWDDYPKYSQAIRALNETGEVCDVMKRLDDGTLTTEF